ncbi:MAG: hypothetical protein J6D08_15030 [Lachnospiraceae bacterium]|nr:hypothetical protein [Lachnospiraceae bacterium]
MEKLVAFLNNDEKDEITEYYEKITAYRNLLTIIQDKELKQKVTNDLAKALQLYDQWWDKMLVRYGWKDKNNLILKFIDGSVWERET